jgi:DNA modification methylase
MAKPKHYDHSIQKVSDLIPYVNNSRTHSDEQVNQVAASIKEFGFTSPILIDEQGGLIAGHGRVMAATKLKIEEVPCITLTGLTEAQKKAYIIADNQLPLNAGWDLDKLKLEVETLKELDFDIDVLGFDDDFLDGLLDVQMEEGLTDEDEVPEAPETPVSVLGDIWELGNHRLMCGDSRSIDAVEKLMDGKKPNAIITDPPYGIGIDGQKESKAKNPKHNRKHHDKKDWDSERPPPQIFENIILMNCPSVIWGGNYFADLLPATRGWLYWSKGQDGLTMSDGELAWTTEDKPLRAKTVNRGQLKGSIHPTQKPVSIMDFSIEFLKVPSKGVILDLFGGSGTTMISAEKAGVFANLMELDPCYIDGIINRWQNFTGKQATHIETGKTYEELKQERES